jgi:hypothetical protein
VDDKEHLWPLGEKGQNKLNLEIQNSENNAMCNKRTRVSDRRNKLDKSNKQVIVNLKNFRNKESLDASFGDNWMYIGRGDSRKGLERSPLANPYSSKSYAVAIKCKTKEEAIGSYREWLWSKIKAGDKKVLAELLKITETTVLVCYCHPEPCHGEVVRKAAGWIRSTVKQNGESE